MIYEYFCSGCSSCFDIVKPVSEYDKEEHCPTSSTTMVRLFSPKVELCNTRVQDAYFNNGLGQVVKNDREAREIAKRRGLVEVGNEDVKKHITPPTSEY